MTVLVSRAPLAPSVTSSSARLALVRITGSTAPDPDAFARILDRLLLVGAVPFTIAMARRARSIRFEIEAGGLERADLAALAERLRVMPMTRCVEVRGPTRMRRRKAAASARAKPGQGREGGRQGGGSSRRAFEVPGRASSATTVP